jgi:hypothetical protein
MTDLAALSRSLKDNEAFQAALDSVRGRAIEALCAVDADDKNSLLKAQATVAVVDDIRADLEAFIRQGQPKPLRAIP